MSTIGFLVDTDVISETARPRPTARVIDWLADQGSVALSAISVYELARGIEKLAAGRRRRFLEEWFSRLVDGTIEIIHFDRDAALQAARVEGDARRRGRGIETRDLFILASAAARGLSVATRSAEHFRGHGIVVYDPFQDVHAI